MSLIDNLKKIDNKYIVFILLILVVFVIYFITKKENMTADSQNCWDITKEDQCNNNEKCLWLKDAFVCTSKPQPDPVKNTIETTKPLKALDGGQIFINNINNDTVKSELVKPDLVKTDLVKTDLVEPELLGSITAKSYPDATATKSYPDATATKSYPDATATKSYPDATATKSYPDATTVQDIKTFDDLLKICGNQDKINKIKTNIESIGKYRENMRNSNNKLDGLTDIFMDDKVYTLIDETINIFTSMTNDEMYCFYNNTMDNMYKNKQCRSIQQLSNMNDMHSKINKMVNKYINILIKLRKRLLNVQLFVVNKDCTNITNKKNKLDDMIKEYNTSLKRAFQLLYIYPNEQKKLLEQIQ